MDELISREAVKQCAITMFGQRYVDVRDVDAAPAVVVRCGKCRWYGDGNCKILKNSYGGPLERGEHDFCSDGDRMNLSDGEGAQHETN